MNRLGQIAREVLRRAGWLPARPAPPRSSPFDEVVPGSNLLDPLLRTWVEEGGYPLRPASESTGCGHASHRRPAWACAQLAAGAQLTIGPDLDRFAGGAPGGGLRLVWWPVGIPRGRRVGLISSHLGRDVNRQRDWAQRFRAACRQIDPIGELIVSAPTTTAHEFALRAADHFGLRLLIISPPAGQRRWQQWLQSLPAEPVPAIYGSTGSRVERCRISDAVPHRVTPRCFAAHVSPTLNLDDQVDARSSTSDRSRPPPSLADRLVIGLANRLSVLYLRPGSRLLPLVQARLRAPGSQPGEVRIALGPGSVPSRLAEQLLTLGAVGWVCQPTQTMHGLRDAPSNSDRPPASATGMSGGAPHTLERAPLAPGDYLTHCTRAAQGAWPDQTREAFLDELLLSPETVDRTALASLRRILQQNLILASSRGIRGGTNVVSLTAVRLEDLRRMRTFRAHRGRWDFEPYGICIRKDDLVRLGARSVIYGDDADWESLAERDRPFYQRQWSRGGRDGGPIDWSQEREWRVQANIDLRQLDVESAFAFVPTAAEAERLQPYCRWPILVLGKG